MKSVCEACARGDHDNCGMQTWCECECAGPDGAGMPDPSDIVGHKTFDAGERDENGMPKFRHEPLTRAEGEAMWEAAKAAEAKRAEQMPDERAAIHALWDAYQRLKELGWRDGKYSPRDGTRFKTIEVGSTGVFDGDCHGEWPNCTWTTYDQHDAYPSSQPPVLFKLYPKDQAKYDERMETARKRYAAECAAMQHHEFMGGDATCEGFAGGVCILLAASCLVVYALDQVGWGPRFDDSDSPPVRSGVRIVNDKRTGCQYFQTWSGGITPRMDQNGKHLCN